MLTCLPDEEMRPICVPLRWPGMARECWGLGASLSCLMLHPQGEASHHIPLPDECKFTTNIFQHPIFGLHWAVLLWGPVDCSYMHRGLCRVISCEVDVLQNLKGGRVMISIQPKMLPASYCPGPGVCGLGRGYGVLLLLGFGTYRSFAMNYKASESSMVYLTQIPAAIKIYAY